mmetsp:Transcript_53987/g.107467  ORF Transcript_53987/g.107467 Transcript_53987/m.107467 type:complete len:209 (+) Transcript_53987:166-792(+)
MHHCSCRIDGDPAAAALSARDGALYESDFCGVGSRQTALPFGELDAEVLAARSFRAQHLAIVDGVQTQRQVTFRTVRWEDSGRCQCRHVHYSYVHAIELLWNIGLGTKLHVLVLVGDAALAVEGPRQKANSTWWAGEAECKSIRQMAIRCCLEERKVHATKHGLAPPLACKRIGLFAKIVAKHVQWKPSYIVLKTNRRGRGAGSLGEC